MWPMKEIANFEKDKRSQLKRLELMSKLYCCKLCILSDILVPLIQKLSYPEKKNYKANVNIFGY